MISLRHLLFTLTVLAFLSGCTKTMTVTIPPRVDLKAYPVIGVLDFSAQPSELGSNATQKFISHISSAQPGLRLLELGSRQKLLKEVGRSELDLQAIKALGQKYGVTALISGTVELSEPRSKVAGNMGPGTGFLIEGTAEIAAAGADFDLIKAKFSWARAVMAVTIASATQTL